MGKYVAHAAVAVVSILAVVYVWRVDLDRALYRECLKVSEKAIETARETRTIPYVPSCHF